MRSLHIEVLTEYGTFLHQEHQNLEKANEIYRKSIQILQRISIDNRSAFNFDVSLRLEATRELLRRCQEERAAMAPQ